ncbi:MAG: hypothetical protein EOO96_23150, partial [Pedobacter sp.]
MTRIPIYQMTFGQNAKEVDGLVFTSEHENNGNQTILFTIPIIEPFENPFDFIEYFERSTFYFPFLLNGRYMDLEAKVEFPEFTFDVPE